MQVKPSASSYYYKLPYVGSFTIEAQKRLRKLIQRYCNNIEIKLGFSSCKVSSIQCGGSCTSRSLFACCLQIFLCSRHLSIHIREDLSRDRNSHIFQHLQPSMTCRKVCSKRCFSVLDSAPNRLQLILKEAARICWENPTLNKQLKHADLTLPF